MGTASELGYAVLAGWFFLPSHHADFTDLGGWTRYSPVAALGLVALLGCLFTLYFASVRLLEPFSRVNGPVQKRAALVVLGFAALFGITLALMYPITAIDLFNYVFRSRILTHYGDNPLVVPPASYPADPFVRYTGGWAGWPTPYGPLWIIISAPATLISGDSWLLNLLSFKALALGFYLADSLLVYCFLRRSAPSCALVGLTLFAWNPLVLFDGIGNGHNDLVMVFFVLLSLYLLDRGHLTLSVAALAGSVMVKYVTLLLVPIYVVYLWHRFPNWQGRLLFAVKSFGVVVAMAAILYAPFWHGTDTLRGAIGQGSIYISSVPTLLLIFLEGIGGPHARTITTALTLAVFFLVYAAHWQRSQREPMDLVRGYFNVLYVYLLVAVTQMESWYVIWPVALGSLLSDRVIHERAMLFSATALASVVAFAYVWPWTHASFLTMNIIAVGILVGPLVALHIYRSPFARPGKARQP